MASYIPVSAIYSYSAGTVHGRIISIEQHGLYLSDQTGAAFFTSSGPLTGIHEGDIAAVHFLIHEQKAVISDLTILTRSRINPLEAPASLYSKCSKNSYQLRERLQRRQIFFRLIGDFFIRRDFLEIHTPTLVESPGMETYLEPFSTRYEGFSSDYRDFYLPTSPEFSLKEALTTGLEKIFEIARVFRNQGENSQLHRPEFFMLEWYRAYEDYTVIMDDLEALLKFLLESIYKTTGFTYKTSHISCDSFERIGVRDLFADLDIDLDDYTANEAEFCSQAASCLSINAGDLTKADLFFKVFLDKIEPRLGWEKPVIVHDYPISMCPLSRPCPGNPLYGQRFELFIAGVELANAYGELTDPDEQTKRFQMVLQERQFLNKTPLPLPSRFLRALAYGIPPCSGIALGVERLFMLFENASSLGEVSLFDFDGY